MEQDNFNTTQMDSRERLRSLYLQPGDVIAGNYEFVRELGHGGMGMVCLCRDKVANGRLMAVKTVPDILRNDDEAVAALTREYDNMYSLTNDGIVAVRHLVRDDFRYYVVMDYAEGETLVAYLSKHRKPGEAVAFEVVRRIAEALDYAHGKDMVHRDIKPGNVMVQIDGATVKSVKLLDFGLGLQIKKSFSRTTGQLTSGTPAYKSPEQWDPRRFGKPSFNSDQYSLAVMAYEMLSGDYPFAEYEDMETFRVAVLNDEPERISGIADYVNDALQKALAKRQEDRFKSCTEFANALKQPSVIVERPAPQPQQNTVAPPLRPVFVEKPSSQPPVIKTPPSISKDMTLMLPGNVPLELVHIRAGSFTMGSPASEPERLSYETLHRVTLTKDYWIGRYEVTQWQWQVVMGSNPSNFKKGYCYPVEYVSWEDAMKFCQKVTDQERTAGRLTEKYEYTLPTEAQWEYACRAGTTTPFSFGSTLNGDKANCDGNYPYGMGKGEYLNNTTVVGSYMPNAWGLYDMHGNVWEWCRDWYGDYPTSDVSDPVGPLSGSRRVLRGGSWYDGAGGCRSANRNFSDPAYRFNFVGFRVALASVQ